MSESVFKTTDYNTINLSYADTLLIGTHEKIYIIVTNSCNALVIFFFFPSLFASVEHSELSKPDWLFRI